MFRLHRTKHSAPHGAASRFVHGELQTYRRSAAGASKRLFRVSAPGMLAGRWAFVPTPPSENVHQTLERQAWLGELKHE